MVSDHLLALTQKKNMMKRKQVCNVEIRIEETWTLLKAKKVIKKNVKISKCQNIKVGNSSSIKWERWTCVVTYWFEKFKDISTISPLLLVQDILTIRN